MPNVLVTTPFDEAQLDRLRQVSSRLTVTQGDPETADYAPTDVLYAGSLPRDPSRAPNLKWVQVHMAGVNALYDHAITALLGLAHRLPRMVEWQGRGTWPPDEQRWPLFVPTAVRGATLGVIGYGSIGRELARIARTAFAMSVLACKREPARRADPGYCPPGTGDPEGVLPDEWFSPERVSELLARSDVVVMCAPLTRETHHMIGARELRAMKPTAYFINVGRGASVDEVALAQALAERRIAGAAVDVFAQEPPPAGHPLYKVDNVIVSPHVSGFVASYDDDCCTLFVENLRRYLDGAPLLNLVDRAKGY